MLLNDAVTFEARRVAAAFGVEEWEWHKDFTGSIEAISTKAHFFFHFRGKPWDTIYCVGDNAYSLDDCDLRHYHGGWHLKLSSEHSLNELMARGLYCLGIKDEEVLAQLPELSAHEKLEARLTMPREFWCQPWLEEAENMSQIDI